MNGQSTEDGRIQNAASDIFKHKKRRRKRRQQTPLSELGSSNGIEVTRPTPAFSRMTSGALKRAATRDFLQ